MGRSPRELKQRGRLPLVTVVDAVTAAMKLGPVHKVHVGLPAGRCACLWVSGTSCFRKPLLSPDNHLSLKAWHVGVTFGPGQDGEWVGYYVRELNVRTF